MKSANMKEIYIEFSLTLSVLLRGWKLNKNLLIYLFKLIFSGATVGTALTCPPIEERICCQSLPRVASGTTDHTCITEHEGFRC